MKQTYKIFLSLVGVIVGTECVYYGLKSFLNWRNYKKSKEKVYKVLFFPDEGILNNSKTKDLMLKPEGIKEYVSGGIDAINDVFKSIMVDSKVEERVSTSEIINNSKSFKEILKLIHSAEISIDICIYVFSSIDLALAIIKAKVKYHYLLFSFH